MRKYAFLKDNIIVKIESVSDESISESAKEYQLVIDIEDDAISPEVNWILVGNELKSPNILSTIDEITADQQKNQRIFGQKLSEILVDKMGARNLKFTLEGQTLNVASLLQALGSIKSLLDTGALKTARAIITQVKPSFTPYSDILDFAIAEITNFLTEKGYN
jgi:hypothetical protein